MKLHCNNKQKKKKKKKKKNEISSPYIGLNNQESQHEESMNRGVGSREGRQQKKKKERREFNGY